MSQFQASSASGAYPRAQRTYVPGTIVEILELYKAYKIMLWSEPVVSAFAVATVLRPAFDHYHLLPAGAIIASTFGNWPAIKALSEAHGWSQSKTLFVGMLMGLSPVLFFGFIGYYSLYSRVSFLFTRYGIHCGILGPSKAKIEAAIKIRKNAKGLTKPDQWRSDNFAVERRPFA